MVSSAHLLAVAFSALVGGVLADVVRFRRSRGDAAAASGGVSCTGGVMTGPISIGGSSSATYMAGTGGSTDGGRLTIQHNAGLSVFSQCATDWEPESIAQFKLLGRTMTFTVDLSNVGCACNLAFYLISSPARDLHGKFHAGSDRGGQPAYYCDANQVGGQWCPELDIMEANNHAFQSTAHTCAAPVNGHYTYCDRGGCAETTVKHRGSYGPGDAFDIDTRLPFEVETAFPEDDGVLVGMITTLRQGRKEVVLEHPDCQREYLAAMSQAMQDGMSLRITYWGEKAQTMSWMDDAVCGVQNCSGKNAGQAVISDIAVSAKKSLEDFGIQGPTTTTAAPTEFAMDWVANPWATWQCHRYVGDQSDTKWCAHAGIQGGFEYEYNAGSDSPCGGCWCCKRKARAVRAASTTEPAAAPAAAPSQDEPVWVVSDASDKLFGKVVPEEITNDGDKFASIHSRGIAEWRNSRHFVQQMRRGDMAAKLRQARKEAPEEEPCFDANCKTSLLEQASSLGVVLQKFAIRNPLAGAARGSAALAACSLAALAGALLVAGAVLALAVRRVRSSREASPPAASGDPPRHHEGAPQPAQSGLRRVGSSCQRLLALQELAA